MPPSGVASTVTFGSAGSSARPDVMVFGCTSAGALRGNAYEAELIKRIADETGAETFSVAASVRRVIREAESELLERDAIGGDVVVNEKQEPMIGGRDLLQRLVDRAQIMLLVEIFGHRAEVADEAAAARELQ